MRDNEWTARREGDKVVDLNEARSSNNNVDDGSSTPKDPSGFSITKLSSKERGDDERDSNSNTKERKDRKNMNYDKEEKVSNKNKDSFETATAVDADADWSVVQTMKKKGSNSSKDNSNTGNSNKDKNNENNKGDRQRKGGNNNTNGSSKNNAVKKEGSQGRQNNRQNNRAHGNQQQNHDQKKGNGPNYSHNPKNTTENGEESSKQNRSSSVPLELNKDQIKKVKLAVEEYYVSCIIEEPCILLKEIVHPELMNIAVKTLLIHSVEKKEKDRSMLGELLVRLHQDKVGLLSSNQATIGVVKFLDELDDLIIDAPKAGSYVATIIGSLIIENLVSLSLFNSIPADNMFAMSYRAADFIAQILAVLTKSKGLDYSKKIFENSKVSLKSLIPCKEEADMEIKSLIEKYELPYLC